MFNSLPVMVDLVVRECSLKNVGKSFVRSSLSEHPAVVEFYDFWECGTDAELNERFEFVWSSFSNQKWGNESIKEKVRAWIVSRFVC